MNALKFWNPAKSGAIGGLIAGAILNGIVYLMEKWLCQ